jgi:hypothetical protein
MNINSDNNTFEDNNGTAESLGNMKDNNSEENLVKDLEDSLRESVDQSLNTLNSLMKEIQEKVEDESIKEETKKIINLLSENILKLANRNIDEIGISKNLEQSSLEEE